MKDNKARKQIIDLEMKMENLPTSNRLVIRDCTKCKHQTPQIKGDGGEWFTLGWVCSSRREYDYLCLVCGSKLECITKTECKVIKEKE